MHTLMLYCHGGLEGGCLIVSLPTLGQMTVLLPQSSKERHDLEHISIAFVIMHRNDMKFID